METSTMLYIGLGLLLFIGVYYYFYQKEKKELPETIKTRAGQQPQTHAHSLQLQAYERLVILAERIAIPNLVSRSNQAGVGKTEMQLLLTQTIRQEFEHNLAQQIYVSTEAWEAIRNLKEQNIHLINQIASIMPEQATGPELNKKLLDFVAHQQNGSMHTMVQDALSYEAKKLMK